MEYFRLVNAAIVKERAESALYERNILEKPKLSPLVRQIAPQAEHLSIVTAS